MSASTDTEQYQKAFNEAYNKLNESQKKAVDTIEGPVMVIAGPGTGKTQILTLRIAKILLETDTTAGNILALTFTESGAKAMRQRLHRYIGSRAYQVQMYTFHGFAEKLIREYPGSYDRIVGSTPASDIDKIRIIESIIDTSGIKILRPGGDPSYYVMHILRMIGELKKEYKSPDDLSLIIARQDTELLNIEEFHTKGAHKGKLRGEYTKKQEAIAKNRELLTVYRQYEAMLKAQKSYDFEDMITQTVIALTQNPHMLLDVQEQYQYVLADEHQDVNGSQNKILELLASYHERPNIFVVGDEKQAIYRFQGASLENFLYFQDRFKGTTVISLTENYRSGQTILDGAHSLVAIEAGPLSALRVPLTAAVVASSLISRRAFSHQAVEDSWIVTSIQSELASGIVPEEVAVIVRTNHEVESITALLRASGIVVEASADGDILVHPITVTIESLVSVTIGQSNESAVAALIHGAYWGLSASDVLCILQARSYTQSLMTILQSQEILVEIGVVNCAAAFAISTVIETAREKAVSEPPHRVLQHLIQESGLLEYVIAHDPFEGVRVIRRLYDEVEALVLHNGVATLSEVALIFAQRREYHLPMNAPYINTNHHAVQVLTAHKSKGLEFTSVYLPHLQDSIWGGGTKRSYFDIPLQSLVTTLDTDAFDDEKRLLYVAMTRAKVNLNFSYAENSTAGKVLVPSRLFDAIDAPTITEESVDDLESAFSPLKALSHTLVPTPLTIEVLTETLSQRGFSATSLNNYLKNPWDFIYRNVLRIPEVQPAHMQFGTAIHSVLEYVTKHYVTHTIVPSDTAIKAKLEQALNNLPISTQEYSRLLEKGLSVLYPYIAHIAKTIPAQTKEELSIRVVLETGLPELPQLPLTGKLDRIDIGTDGYAVQVVDYKTGKPKTRNAIEGKTASSDGGYKRQLVFYALLLKLYGDSRYQTKQGVLSFVEPDAKGIIHEEVFSVTDEEIQALQVEIIDAVRTLISGTFWFDTDLAAASEYAHLVALLVKR